MTIYHEGTRNPSTGKGPRIGNTPLPPVRKNEEELNMLKGKALSMDDKELLLVNMNMTDKEKVEMLFNYIDALNSVFGSGINRMSLRQSIVKSFEEIEKILMSDGPSIYWKEELKKLGRSK